MRRSGPPDEAPWWSPADQALIEAPLLDRHAFAGRWRETPMLNNAEQLDPFPPGPDTDAVLEARAARRLTALDEGQAWRGLRPVALAVLRTEAFAEADATAHRAAWQRGGARCLEATWRARWAERDHPGGWVEARQRPDDEVRVALAEPVGRRRVPAVAAGERDAVAAAVDWLRVEDHTDPSGAGSVAIYEHVTVWHGRLLVTLTVRHGLDDELDVAVASALGVLWGRLPEVPAPGA